MNSLRAILISALLIRLVFVFLIPAWQSPDEYPHYYYARYIAENNRLPVSSPQYPYYESYQPPLCYILSAAVLKIVPGTTEPPDLSLPQGRPGADLIILRIISVLLSAVAIFLIYKVIRDVFPSQPEIAALGSWFCTLLPTFISNSTGFSNDPPAVLIGTLLLLLLIQDKHKERPLLFGIILGIGTLVKPSLNLFYVVVLMCYFKGIADRRTAILRMTKCFAAALIVVSPYIWHNYITYGSLLAVNPGHDAGIAYLYGSAGKYYSVFRNYFWSFWAAFGRIYEYHLHPMIYLGVFFPFSVAGVAGFLKLLVKLKTHKEINIKKIYLILIVILINSLLVSFYSLSYPVNTAWGKFLFPSLAGLAMIITAGLFNLRDNKTGLILNVVLLTVMSGTDLWFLCKFL